MGPHRRGRLPRPGPRPRRAGVRRAEPATRWPSCRRRSRPRPASWSTAATPSPRTPPPRARRARRRAHGGARRRRLARRGAARRARPVPPRRGRASCRGTIVGAAAGRHAAGGRLARPRRRARDRRRAAARASAGAATPAATPRRPPERRRARVDAPGPSSQPAGLSAVAGCLSGRGDYLRHRRRRCTGVDSASSGSSAGWS